MYTVPDWGMRHGDCSPKSIDQLREESGQATYAEFDITGGLTQWRPQGWCHMVMSVFPPTALSTPLTSRHSQLMDLYYLQPMRVQCRNLAQILYYIRMSNKWSFYASHENWVNRSWDGGCYVALSVVSRTIFSWTRAFQSVSMLPKSILYLILATDNNAEVRRAVHGIKFCAQLKKKKKASGTREVLKTTYERLLCRVHIFRWHKAFK